VIAGEAADLVRAVRPAHLIVREIVGGNVGGIGPAQPVR